MTEIDAYKYWENRMNGKAPGTLEQYRLVLQNFFAAVGLTPNELIARKKLSLESKRDLREQNEVEDLVLQYIKTRPISSATRKAQLSAILGFFKQNRYPLSISTSDFEDTDSVGSRIPTKQEIIKIADAAGGWKSRAAIMVLKDSGLRASDLKLLIWEKKVDYGEGFWGWVIVTQKRGVKAQVFIGPESTRQLSEFKTQTGQVFRIGTQHLVWTINQAIQKALGKPNSESGLTAHGLRKFYFSALQHGRVPESYILQMQGKRSSVYSENRPDVLLEAYKSAYGELSLSNGNGNNSQAITELKEQMKYKDSELRELREDYYKLKTLVEKLLAEKEA